MDSSDPPFYETYKALFDKAAIEESRPTKREQVMFASSLEECEPPLIDLSQLDESRDCKSEIARASREWGFFQVVNHGISREILERMRREQVKVFRQPFEKKINEVKFLNFSSGSYRWGTPAATCLKQLSWSEAFHVPLADISGSDGCGSLSSTMEQFAGTVSDLANKLAEILAEDLGHKSDYFKENCLANTCYLRMNRYPPCPMFPNSNVFGLMPHTDSDFLTILYQDDVGGLQLVRDGQWFAVKPNPDALIVNIGDLFQAWSNGVYKSVEHRVVTNPRVERFSSAYFLCPFHDTVIKSCGQPPVYRNFSFREYRQQVQDDVQKLGQKVGLPRFLL
ncbi:gibberellin 2-beta-dioxygenase 8 isoform X2 [Punica granatum]|nr:gibberellin 2-beta-dioxygenase 8 isoform X2 [Punica granatum]